MIEIIVAIVIVLSILTIVMYALLHHVVKEINKQSKEFFVLKLQDYDDLIVEKEEKIKSINEQKEVIINDDIEYHDEINDAKTVVVSDRDLNYQMDNIFTSIKKIDDKFKINNEEIIQKFLNNNSRNEKQKMYEELRKIRSDILQKGLYNIITTNNEVTIYKNILSSCSIDCREIIKNYFENTNEINIDCFLDFIEIEMIKFSPTITVVVGEKNKNYNYISNDIKTVYDPKIYKGLKIIYQGIMYDYSLE